MVWVLFICGILAFLALDLGVFNREAHIVKPKEAAIWTSVWVLIAILFSGVIWWLFAEGKLPNPTGLEPRQALLHYITGYLIELSLSIDNVFVIAVIFRSFKIPELYQHRILFWGIIGAVLFRALMIVFGVALFNYFDWIIYVFGGFLLVTAFKMLKSEEGEFKPKESFIFQSLRKLYPFTAFMDGDRFFIRRRNLRIATPLFMALVIIEFTDILFALDSIPAVLSITSDPFLVFSSNILAILGLRSMYFLISGMMAKFRYIHYSLAFILAFVGLKLIIGHQVVLPEWISLVVIAFSLISGILFSLLIPIRQESSH